MAESVELVEEGGGCLIATATYGSELAPQVQQLRELRDNTILSTESGIAFMAGFNQFYYSFSPTIADLEREYPVFKEVVKLSITPMLSTLSILNYAEIDSEQEMLSFGIGIILMNVGMYFVAPAIIIHKIRKQL
jgi:peptidyl-prolyl cis-trans isomerase B (cyclophilin B)